MDYKYQGYTGKASGIFAGLGKSASAYASYTKQREDDEKKKQALQAQQEQLQQAVESGQVNEDGSERTFSDKAGDFVKGVPAALLQDFTRMGTGIGEVINDITGGTDRREAELEKRREEDMKMIKSYGERMKSAKSPDEKERYRKALGDLMKRSDESYEETQSRSEETIDRTDPAKAAGAAAGIALDILTAGTAGAAIKGGRAALKTGQLATKAKKAENALDAAGKASKVDGKLIKGLDAISNPTGVKGAMKSGAVLGAGYGAAGTLEDKGSEATFMDYVTGTAIGAGAGTVLGGTMGALGKGFQKLAKAGSPEDVAKAADDVVAANKPQAQLGAGYRAVSDIDNDVAAVISKEDPELYKYTDANGDDVTSQVAYFDKEIRARKTAIKQLSDQADGVDLNTGKSEIPEAAAAQDVSGATSDVSEFTGDALARGNAAQAVEKLKGEIADLAEQQNKAFTSLGGVQKTFDNELATSKFKALTKELKDAKEYEANVKNAYAQDTAADVDVNALAKERADLEAGIIPTEMMKPFKKARSTDDVISMMADIDPNDTKGFIKGADDLLQERMTLADELDDLYTKEKLDADTASISKKYNEELESYQDLAEPIRIRKIEELNAKTAAQYDEMNELLAADAADVTDNAARLADVEKLERAMIEEAQAIQSSDPELFRPVDESAVEARINEIKYQEALANDALASKAALRELHQSGEDIAELAATNPSVSKMVDKEVKTSTVSMMDNTGKSPGLGWVIGTPTEVLNKFGAIGKKVSTILREAVDHKESLDGVFEMKMTQLGKLIKGKESTELVAKALDGDEVALKSLNGEQRQAHDMIREMFESYADQLGLPKSARIKDYLPHMFEGQSFDDVEKTLAYLRSGKIDGKKLTQKQITEMENSLPRVDANTLAYLASKNTYTAKNGFLKKRKGAKDYTLDLEKILTSYHSAASSDIAYKPAITEANKMTPGLTKEQNTYVSAVFKNLQGETDTTIERAIDGALDNFSRMTGKNLGGDGTTSRLSRGARTAIYNATIGANPGSAIRNTQQMVNVYTEVGAKAVLEAAPRALAALKKDSPMREVLYRNGVLSNRQGSYLQGGAMPKFNDKGTKALWGMFNTTESLNRATAFFAGYDKHLAKFPKDIKGAEKAGSDLARKTQFKFSAIDIPVSMQGDFAKNFLQMQTYNIQQTQYIAKMVGEGANLKKLFTQNKDQSWSMRLEPQKKLARFLGGNAAFFGTVGAATGMDWKEAVPFLNDAQRGEVPRSPMYQTIFGDGRANPGMVGAIASGASAVFNGKWDDALEDADNFARSAVRTMLPGGNQAVKTIEGTASATSGLSTTGSGITDTIDKAISAATGQTPGGNIRFTQGDDAWSKFKASVLGQYATKEGRDWVDEGMVNVPSSLKIDGVNASQYIKGLSREKQEQYVGYFTTKSSVQSDMRESGITKTKKRTEIVEGLRSGNITEADAIRAAAEYNQQIVEMMTPYLRGNTKIPARIFDDIQSNMMLNISSAIASSKRTPSLNQMEKMMGFAVDDGEDYDT